LITSLPANPFAITTTVSLGLVVAINGDHIESSYRRLFAMPAAENQRPPRQRSVMKQSMVSHDCG